MAIETTCTHARANLAALMNRVVDERQTVIIRRRGHEDVAMVAASELSGLLETIHLLRSPRNAERLLSALESVRQRDVAPQTIGELRAELGLESDD